MPNTQSVTAVAPILVLGLILAGLLFHEIPAPNKEIMLTIVSGLLGYLSRGERHSGDGK